MAASDLSVPIFVCVCVSWQILTNLFRSASTDKEVLPHAGVAFEFFFYSVSSSGEKKSQTTAESMRYDTLRLFKWA